MKEKIYMILQAVLVAITIAFLISMVSCKSQAVVLPQKQDSVRIVTNTKYDSLFIDRWHVIKEKGDTIVIQDSIFIEKWRWRTKVDSVIIRDSIPYEVKVVKEVRKRNGYDKFTARGFWVLLALILIVVSLRIYVRFKTGK